MLFRSQTNDSGPTNVVVTSIDAAGNTATETFNGLVTIDTVAPTITINGEASNNATTTLAKAGDVITTTFTSTDPVTSVTIGGHTVTATPVIGQANTYTASYTVQTSDNAGSTNVVVRSTDAAGNTATQTFNGLVTIDTVAPTATITVNDITADNLININEFYGSDLPVTGTVSGDAHVGDVITLTVGTHTYTGTVAADLTYSIDVPADVLAGSSQVTASITTTDAAGNSSTANSTHTFNTDLLAPTITINGETSNNGVNSLARAGDVITTTFTSTDTVTSVTIGGHTVTATPVIGQANKIGRAHV